MISVCEILIKQDHLSVLADCTHTSAKKQKCTFVAQVSTKIFCVWYAFLKEEPVFQFSWDQKLRKNWWVELLKLFWDFSQTCLLQVFWFVSPWPLSVIEVAIEILRKQLVVEFDLECDGNYMNMYYMKSEAATAEKRETTLKSHMSFRYSIPNSPWSVEKK